MWSLLGPEGGLVDGSLVVTLEQTRQALKLLANRAHVIAEGAGALPLAAVMNGLATPSSTSSTSPTTRRQKVVCIVSGGNIDLSVFTDLVK
jgi:threonine dehydratase